MTQLTDQPDAARQAGRVRPLALQDVRIHDSFWSPRQETVRTSTLAAELDQLRAVGQLDALRLTWRPGDEPVPHIFWDSDVAKWIEAASYSLATHPDDDLEREVDEAIELLAGAQQPDGYLNTYFTVVQPGERFTDLRDAHELYCAGHLIEAGVAHFEATGKTRLLDVVKRYADLIADVFGTGSGQKRGYDGHEEIELALVKLYRATGERRYLELATYFIDERGREPYYFDQEAEDRGTPGYFARHFPDRVDHPRRYREYLQAHLPVREQTEAVGHAVRAMYLYSAMADLAEENDDESLRRACRTLWGHLTSTRLYLTGGIGSSADNEGFTRDFDLPDFDAYAETCAAIGLVLWSSRMARLERDAGYIDVLERALYNGVLAGLSADGTCFFYDNPLASRGDKHRQRWFGVACCPPNIARTLSSLGAYIYSAGERGLFLDLFIGSTAAVTLAGARVSIRQTTDYPWDGRVRVDVATDGAPVSFALHVRVPGWARGASILVNGQAQDLGSIDRGYLTVDREWTTGDVVELLLPMEPRRTWAAPEVPATIGRVALERGPLVYCVEDADHGDGVEHLVLPRGAALTAEPAPDPTLGVVRLTAAAAAVTADGWGGALYRDRPPVEREATLTAVPYFSWDNREPGGMRVWVRERP